MAGGLCSRFLFSRGPDAQSRLTSFPTDLDSQLREVLTSYRFTGKVENTLEKRLGRPLDPIKAELGRSLFFDKFGGLHGDNSCSGCHSPLNGFGDSQSIAIGVENMTSSGRSGPVRGISVALRRSSSLAKRNNV